MPRYSCALALLALLSLTVCCEGFRLKRKTGGNSASTVLFETSEGIGGDSTKRPRCCSARCASSNDCGGKDFFCCPRHRMCMDRSTGGNYGPNCNRIKKSCSKPRADPIAQRVDIKCDPDDPHSFAQGAAEEDQDEVYDEKQDEGAKDDPAAPIEEEAEGREADDDQAALIEEAGAVDGKIGDEHQEEVADEEQGEEAEDNQAALIEEAGSIDGEIGDEHQEEVVDEEQGEEAEDDPAAFIEEEAEAEADDDQEQDEEVDDEEQFEEAEDDPAALIDEEAEAEAVDDQEHAEEVDDEEQVEEAEDDPAALIEEEAEGVMQPARVDIADIVLHDFKNWYIIKNGQTVQENMEGKYVSAKPNNIMWTRIGTWDYTKSNTQTGALIKVRLNGSRGSLVKTDLALRFQYGGRVKLWAAHEELHNKGRFLRKIRVIPFGTHVASGYKLDARVSKITIGRSGSRSNPVAKAKLNIRIIYGKIGTPFSEFIKKNYEITVLGTGQYSARMLSSEGR